MSKSVRKPSPTLTTPPRDSLSEWSAEVCRTEFGRHAPAIETYLRQFHPKEMARAEAQPFEIVRRELLAEFRRGTSEFLRAGVWEFLETERKRRKLTQDQLAERAGVTQPTYSKISSGESSFESIAMFLRALNLPLAAVPTPSATDMTIAGLVRALAYLKSEVFSIRCPVLGPEDAEWLLHMDACQPWQQVLQTMHDREGTLVARCLAASVAIRLRRPIVARSFERLVQLWREWSGEWEICMSTISPVVREGAAYEPVAS